MSERAMLKFRRLNSTPLRDLLLLRITGRLDWNSRLKSSDLPAVASELIGRVVRRTRLWRLEKAAVADELISHFVEGLSAGTSLAEMVDRFGDQRVAAQLIRRAKIRNRPLPWHALVFALRFVGVLAGIYALLLIRFIVERPSPHVDYVSQLNAAASATALSDRAWPLYHQAVIACSDGMANHLLVFSKVLSWGKDKPRWNEHVSWLNQHTAAIELMRKASQKPVMGFILDATDSVDDPSQLPCNPEHHLAVSDGQIDPSQQTHDHDLDIVYMALDLDTKRAILANDGKTAEEDLMAFLGYARQLQTDLVSPGRMWADHEIVGKIQWLLTTHPGLLNDQQLIGLAHAISGPKVAADLLTDRIRFYVPDLLQNIFTEDGNGDGHLSLAGMRSLRGYFSDEIRRYPVESNVYFYAAPVPWLTPSRSQLNALFDQHGEQDQANMHLPIRLVDIDRECDEQDALADSPVESFRYGPWAIGFKEDWELVRQGSCEEYLGDRDGALVGIALELYHRHHGKYPATLGGLMPDFLPEVPVDRITGDPIKYRIVDGKPIVYSVGIDRIDDGGTPPKNEEGTNRFHCPAAAWIRNPADVDRHDDRRGDWVIYPAKISIDDGSE